MHESISLSLTGNSTVLTANYFPSLNVYDDSEIALLSLQTFNSFPNIINAINNRLKIEVIASKRNKYKLHTFEFCLEEGCYEIEDINNKIVKELSHFNTPYSIAPVFGFKKIRCGPFHEARRSDKAVNLNTINSIKVLCNIAHLVIQQSTSKFCNVRVSYFKFNWECYHIILDDENNNTPMICYIKLEEGCYESADINQRVKKQIYDYNSENLTKLTFDISVDPNDFRSYIKYNGILHFEIPFIDDENNNTPMMCYIKLEEGCYEIEDINQRVKNMAPVFGFKKRQYKPEYAIHRSEKAVNLNTINSIKVMCNIAQGSFNNHL
ncbi:Uncharacterized protein FWK35_00019034 [Aphis craccivora]|uniref:Uncharacterized protein n=1 Tax=Aphis craccivora TaxID=307492 RepID=A0A6G0XNS1_APHCR|nr:Uncharacterized protein FWK35_00019034 [Aphis craccivora]